MTLSVAAIEVETKLDRVRALLSLELASDHQACLTCSFQAEDVLLSRLALEFDPDIPTLLLDTGNHFAETYTYRDPIARDWRLNLYNLVPEMTVVGQEAEHGLLCQSAPDQCCKMRKVLPLFKAVAGYSDRTSARTGKEPSRPRRVCAFCSYRRPSGAQARPSRRLVDARCLGRLPTTRYSFAFALRAGLFVNWMRAVDSLPLNPKTRDPADGQDAKWSAASTLRQCR
jgi:hypothetical protein